jgi:hypothetical protein
MKKLLLFSFMLTSALCYSQNDKPEREAFRLKVAIDVENYFETEIDRSSYFVKEKILQIYPGEDLNIEAVIKGDTIYSMKVVKEVLHPEKTIHLEFSLSTRENIKDQMILSVTNPFTKKLNYDAAMYIYGHNEWIDTSIIGIQPGLISYEMWNDKILTLALHNWRLEE